MKKNFWKILLAGALSGALTGGVAATSTEMKPEDMLKVIVSTTVAGAASAAMDPKKKAKSAR